MPDPQAPNKSSDPQSPSDSAAAFVTTLSPRQRRLRVTTAIILILIGLMIFVGFSHPFFHPVIPAAMSRELRRAFAVRALFIILYWSACFFLAFVLVVVAWLDYREIKLKMLMAHRDIFRDIASRSESDRKRSKDSDDTPPKSDAKPPKDGNGTGPPNA